MVMWKQIMQKKRDLGQKLYVADDILYFITFTICGQ